jgi:hypothetical protein
VLDNEPVGADRLRQLVQRPELQSVELPRQLLADVQQRPDARLQAIEAWAASVVEQSSELDSRLAFPGDAQFALARSEADGTTAVWHDMSVALVRVQPGYEVLRLEYEAASADQNRSYQLEGTLSDHYNRDFVDWRFYVGTQTPAVDGESPATRVSASRWRAAVGLRGLGGFLIARFARWRGPATPVRSDPSWRSCLKRSEVRFKEEAARFPTVDGLRAGQDRAVVYVHGTMSCALPGLYAVRDVIGDNVARFEHDTFLPIRHNAIDLADHVLRAGLPARDLHFVGHSRGGLVARLAAARISKCATRAPDRITVHTFGTPHEGTPLVGQALVDLQPLLRRAHLLSGLVADVRDHMWSDFVSYAWTYVLRGRGMPEGILEMAPRDIELQLIASYAAHIPTIAFGAHCEVTAASDTAKIAFLQSVGKEIFDGRNDLVVSEASATAAGDPRPLIGNCTHFDYFLDDQVRQHLAGLT